ncbi:MAG: hypothetical protein QME75_15705 [Deltaproteobacteria bacterium]|nr:hypothetical protein [Deltaproteobacteria bacterium]
MTVVVTVWAGSVLGLGVKSVTARQVFHTQRADIVYEHRGELEELARRLGAVGPGSPPQADLGRLTDQIDGMLAEISRVLQRQPPAQVRLTIQLLRDGVQVQRQQLALRAAPSTHAAPGRPLESYYEPRLRTIFLSLADARLGILAHEMTHFILLESPGARTGEAYQETLARYMEDRFNSGK